jgi:hypothetical protein
MMGILDACCGRFIEETAHLKTGVSEGLQRQEALGAAGVGGHSDDGLEGRFCRKISCVDDLR